MSARRDEHGETGGEAVTATARVLILCDGERLTGRLTALLRAGFPHGLLITLAAALDDAVIELHDRSATAILLGELGGVEAQLDALDALRSAAPDAPVIAVSAAREPHAGAQAVAAGAQDHACIEDLSAESLAEKIRFGLLRKRAETELVARAGEDPLSGLPGRIAFLDRLTLALERTRRAGGSIAVLLLAVDAFAMINETFGPAAGDELLAVLADRLGALLRPADTVARFGPDEFALLVEDVADEQDAATVAERAGRAARAPILIDGDEVSVTVSVGVALIRDGSADADAVMGAAVAAVSRGHGTPAPVGRGEDA